MSGDRCRVCFAPIYAVPAARRGSRKQTFVQLAQHILDRDLARFAGRLLTYSVEKHGCCGGSARLIHFYREAGIEADDGAAAV